MVGGEAGPGAGDASAILTREDGAIDFARTAQQIYDRWRGFQPWPGAHTVLRGKKLIVHRMHMAAERGIEPGVSPSAWRGDGGGLQVAAPVVFEEVQMEGKRRMSAADFCAASRFAAAREARGFDAHTRWCAAATRFGR